MMQSHMSSFKDFDERNFFNEEEKKDEEKKN